MRTSLLRFWLLLVLLLPTTAPAQWFRPTPAPAWQSGGSYSGEWSPHYRPPGWNAPLGEVAFRNLTGAPIELYHLDRHGRWVWTARVAPRAVGVARAPVGDVLIAQDRFGRVAQRTRVVAGRQIVEVSSSWYPDHSAPARQFRLTFRNDSNHPVNLYTIDRSGRWSWVARIPRAAEVQVLSGERQRWRGINERNRTVKDYSAVHGRDTVVIKSN
jgi:hypothetical protein